MKLARISLLVLAVCAAVAGVFLLATTEAAQGENRDHGTDICHFGVAYPFGIDRMVANASIPTHLAHGDCIGFCSDPCPGRPWWLCHAGEFLLGPVTESTFSKHMNRHPLDCHTNVGSCFCE